MLSTIPAGVKAQGHLGVGGSFLVDFSKGKCSFAIVGSGGGCVP